MPNEVLGTLGAMRISEIIEGKLRTADQGQGIIVSHDPIDGIFKVSGVADLEAAVSTLKEFFRESFEVCLAESVLQLKPQSSSSSE